MAVIHRPKKETTASAMIRLFPTLVQLNRSPSAARQKSETEMVSPAFFRIAVLTMVRATPTPHMAISSQSMMPLRLVEVRTLLLPNQLMPHVDTWMNRAAGITKMNRISSAQAFSPFCSLRGVRAKAMEPKNLVCISRLMLAARANIMTTQATPENSCWGSHAVLVSASLVGAALSSFSNLMMAAMVSPLMLPVWCIAP